MKQAEKPKVPEQATFSSTYFIPFSMERNGIRQVLENEGVISTTQYRMLVELFFAHPNPIPQSQLSALLHVKPNVIANAFPQLDRLMFTQRRESEQDARARVTNITPQGIAYIAECEKAITTHFQTVWPPRNDNYKRLFNAITHVAHSIDENIPSTTPKAYPTTHIVAALETIARPIEDETKMQSGYAIPECRVLQRLNETHMPMRVGIVANQLMLTNATTTRTTKSLHEKGLIQRLAHPNDNKAVYIALSPRGEREALRVSNIINYAGSKFFWDRLEEGHKLTFSQLNRVIIAIMKMQRQAQEAAELSSLTAID